MQQCKFFSLARFAGILVVLLTTFIASSCSKDDNDNPSNSGALVGTWVTETTGSSDGGFVSMKITIKFNKDNTGSIVEEWSSQTRASSHESYSMNFSWSTTSNANGDDIMRISYVSGDQNTELFPGSGSTALWTRKYVVTGKILNIYDGDGVWVLNKK